MKPAIVVEGKRDREKLETLLDLTQVDIYCTFGTPGTERIEQLIDEIGQRFVFIFTDNDVSGKKIRALLRDAFPDAEHIHTNKGYAGVEGTPDEYILERLVKAGLEPYLLQK